MWSVTCLGAEGFALDADRRSIANAAGIKVRFDSFFIVHVLFWPVKVLVEYTLDERDVRKGHLGRAVDALQFSNVAPSGGSCAGGSPHTDDPSTHQREAPGLRGIQDLGVIKRQVFNQQTGASAG